MKDLEQEELKKNFKENILYALKNKKNAALRIIFRFSGTHQGSKFKYKETIDYFAGNFTYKNIGLNEWVIDKNTAIKRIIVCIIVYNL